MRFLWLFAALVLATCVALGGPQRAVDLIDPDDPDTVTVSASDDFIATTVNEPVVPAPRHGTVLPSRLKFGPGRLAVVELFRPPQGA